VETVCTACGEQNAPDAQFCSTCRAFLGWREEAPARPQPAVVPPGPPPGPSTAGPVPEERRPFEAGILTAEVTTPLDGTPAEVTVKVSNASTIVDSYLVEPFDLPPWLEVRPGRTELLPSTTGTVVTQLRIASPTLVAAQQLTILLRVRNTNGRLSYRDLPVRVTVPVVSAPLELHAEPRLLRSRDLSPAVCTVMVGNLRSNRWAQVQLSASDPEQVVRAAWGSVQLQVPPGGQARTEVRFDAPPPEPGGEVSRTITITATDGDSRTDTTVTLVQSASRSAIELLAVRLDPSVLRLGGRRRGHLTAVIDNRRGATAVRLGLRGYEPENSLRFAFSPATIDVQPGQQASARVTVSVPRTPPGREVTRPLTIVASDGHSDARADGSVIQLASSQRGLVRVILTLLGGLAMILGALLPFVAGDESSAVELTAARIADELNEWRPNLSLVVEAGGVEDVVSLGLGLMVLGGLVIFGLTGRSGRLTRLAALVGAAVVIVSFVAVARLVDGSGPASGAALALAGCVTGYVGGLLASR
jgi:hypothetical protein